MRFHEIMTDDDLIEALEEGPKDFTARPRPLPPKPSLKRPTENNPVVKKMASSSATNGGALAVR